MYWDNGYGDYGGIHRDTGKENESYDVGVNCSLYERVAAGLGRADQLSNIWGLLGVSC